MKVEYFGHSCFRITSNGYSLVLDPFQKVNGFDDISLTANGVLCSHGHSDHNFKEGVKIADFDGESPFKVTKITVPHDNAGGLLRGKTFVTALEAEGMKIVHFGDVGCENYGELDKVCKDADLFLIPVGGFFTVDSSSAKRIVDKYSPKLTVPMHYREEDRGLCVLSEVDAFTSLFKEVTFIGKNELSLPSKLEGVAVLKV